jgi:hypothetical protein
MTRPSRLQSQNHARLHDAAARFANSIGVDMITHSLARSFANARRLLAVLAAIIALGSTFALSTTTPATACACGCSVFDVGFGGFPQEDDHGGRVFYEWDHSNQTQNWIGSSKASPNANLDKNVNTDWHSIGVQYMFNREWGVSARLPYVDRSFTTEDPNSLMLNTFPSRDLGDLELMAMYTGFAQDMSTGVMFGFKLPTGMYTAPGLDRDTQIGTGSTDLILGAFHRGLITGDNAWQYFAEARLLLPFAYRAAFNPDAGVSQVYKPGAQVDGSAGIVYNNGYNILGFDKITPILQLIASHRERDTGAAADTVNSGFDRLMISPAVEFTKVIDEANKRVIKVYFDVEIPFYYRVNAAINDKGSQGQLIAPVMYRLITSYNF